MRESREGNRRKEPRSPYRAIALLTTIPIMIAVAPLIGWWLGRWVDRRAGTDWVFQGIGVGFGIAAAVRETVLLIRRAQRDLDA
ncbi:MAG: AtpZ/AtpI family protein [Candidatus Eisenbacteria bacterium]|nr:AtpZ/AtpI family protein [Candidatus Eisenbacteria bacterium]